MEDMQNKTSNTNKMTDQMNVQAIKLPKNIRQVGAITSSNKMIYIEDYVMTFIKQLSEKETTICKIAILLGYYVRTEEGKNIFIKGAVEMKDIDLNNGLTFTDEGWTSIYESIKQYFSDVEIVGWALTGPEFFIESGEKIRRLHIDNFAGMDKILLKFDSIEKEEAFYFNENNQLIKQSGYYIYYEKNEEMQNYMVEMKDSVSDEVEYNDHTTKKIRSIIQEKKEVKDDKSVVKLLYAASTLLVIIVLVIAATMLNNYDQMKNVEQAINTISENLSQLAMDNQDSNTQVASSNQNEVPSNNTSPVKNVADNSVTDNKNSNNSSKENLEEQTDEINSDETMNIETVEGNIVEEKEDNEENKPSSDQEPAVNDSSDTQKQGKPDSKEDKTTKPDNNQEAAEEITQTASNDDSQDTSNSEPAQNAEPEPDSQPASADVKYYIVREGDSLVGICFDLYNSTSNLSVIMELNGIEDENKIYAGQKLIVP